MTSKLEVRLLQRISLRIQESIKLTPPITSLTTAREALPKWNRALVEQELYILRLAALILISTRISALGIASALQWLRSVDEADVKHASERFHVRDDESAVLWSRLVGGNEFRESGKAESGQDCGDVCVVAEVEVEDLSGWEGGFHAGKCYCEMYCQLIALRESIVS